MAVSDVLLERGGSQVTNISIREGMWLKFEDFKGTSFKDLP